MTKYAWQWYWWPAIAQGIRQYCYTGEACQQAKGINTKPSGKLHPLPIPTKPWDLIRMDFIGPFPETKGFNYLWVVICRMTIMVHLIPVHTKMRASELHQKNWFCSQAALNYPGMPLDALGYSRASRAIGYPGHTQSKVGFFFCPEGKQFWAGYPRAFSNIVFALGSLWWLRKIEPCTKACPKHVTNIIQTSLLTSL